MPSPRNCWIPKEWDESWPEVDQLRAAYAIEDSLWPDWGSGSPRDVLSPEDYDRFRAAYDEHSRLRQLLDDYAGRRQIVAQSKRPICDLVCDVVEKSEEYGDYIPDGAYEAFRGLMHRHFGYGKPTPKPERAWMRPFMGAPTFSAVSIASYGTVPNPEDAA